MFSSRLQRLHVMSQHWEVNAMQEVKWNNFRNPEALAGFKSQCISRREWTYSKAVRICQDCFYGKDSISINISGGGSQVFSCLHSMTRTSQLWQVKESQRVWEKHRLIGRETWRSRTPCFSCACLSIASSSLLFRIWFVWCQLSQQVILKITLGTSLALFRE